MSMIVASRLSEDLNEEARPAGASVSHKASRTVASHDQPARPAQRYCLTEQDVRCLEQAVAINGGTETAMGRAVAEKLGQTELRASIPHDYVTLGSNVGFRASGQRRINRTLVHWDHFRIPGSQLSLHTPWGVTLLGMKVGETAPAYDRNGVVEELTVDSVIQPLTPPVYPLTKRRVIHTTSCGARSVGSHDAQIE
jgi:hypothetical protein